MKKLIYIGLAATILISCQEKKQYHRSSPEIDLVRKANETYFNGDWQTFKSLFSDKARIWLNAPRRKNTVLTKEQFTDTLKAGVAGFVEFKVGQDPDYEDPLYEMIVDDEGGKWVHAWFTWIGKTKQGKEVITQVHVSSQIKDNKIEIHFVYVNTLPAYLALQAEDSTKIPN